MSIDARRSRGFCDFQRPLALIAGFVLAVLADPAAAQGGRARTPSPPNAVVDFADLKDGARIPEKSTIRFTISNMELVPAGTNRPNVGHHHLLIDTDLPPLGDPIPNDPQHLHFGAAQTEAEVTLPPGEHSLQLLLGDHDHVPHDPPIMSRKIKVTVGPMPAMTSTGRARRSSPEGARVYFITPRNGEIVPPGFVVRFGLTGMGVAPAGIVREGTGHHHLIVDSGLSPAGEPIPNDPQHIHFGAGQTETRLQLAPGRYRLQLVLGDEDHIMHDPPVVSQAITVTVRSYRPRRARRR